MEDERGEEELSCIGDFEEEIEVVHDDSFMRSQKSSKGVSIIVRVGIGAVLAIFCLLVVSVSVSVGVGVSLGTRPKFVDPPNYFRSSDVLESVEYQIALNPKPNWTQRDEMVDKWIASMNDYSELIHLRKEDAVEEYYLQAHYRSYPTHICNTPYFLIRMRQSLYDPKWVTIDIKGDEGDKDVTCRQPYWPAERYYNMSRQKCEEDLHPCFDKFTRGTSIAFLPGTAPRFRTCQDMKELWPDAFDSVSDENKDNLLDEVGRHIWWRLRWSGLLGDHMRYEITFTIEYQGNDMDCITSGVCDIYEGEWSLRFFSEDNQQWELDVIGDLQAMFYHLVIDYDEYEDHVECAHQYFARESLDHIGVEMQYHRSLIPEDEERSWFE